MEQFTNREREVLKKAIRDRKDTYEEYIDECDEILKKLNNMQWEEEIDEEERVETYDIKTLWKTMTFNGGEITLRIKSDNKWYPVIEINADGVYYFSCCVMGWGIFLIILTLLYERFLHAINIAVFPFFENA